MKYIAFTVKGLEKIVEDEITDFDQKVIILDTGIKRIIFNSDKGIDHWARLKTVDDIGIYMGENLDSDYETAFQLIKEYRYIKPEFSVTARKPEEIRKFILNKYGWSYSEKDHSNFDIREFADNEKLFYSVRLTPESLQHRGYKIYANPGSLRPTIAAAMIRITSSGKKGLMMVDNFCGSGTILAEAWLSGQRIYGGDIDKKSVEITQKNLRGLNKDLINQIKVLDGTKSNWPDSFFDMAISNLPWGKQVKAEKLTELYKLTIREYDRIVKPAGAICLLTPRPEVIVKYGKMARPRAKIEQRKIGFTGQTPTIFTIMG